MGIIMNKNYLITFFVIGLMLVISASASVADEKKLDNLIIYGEGFSFSVKEPSGWTGDTSNAAAILANVLFFKDGETCQTENVTILVRINKKMDESVEKDLEFDMDQYRNQYPTVQFKDITVTHLQYKTYSKLFYVKDTFYEYVTYVNPGSGKPVTFSVSMNVQKNEASKEAFAAYQKIIGTLSLLNP